MAPLNRLGAQLFRPNALKFGAHRTVQPVVRSRLMLQARNVSSLSPTASRQYAAQITHKLPEERDMEGVSTQRFRDFDLQNKVFIVTGGGRGLGLTMAEALVEAGGTVHCLDRLEEPSSEFSTAQKRAPSTYGGSLHYHSMDVRNLKNLEETIGGVAAKHQRLDGLIAAAGVQQITPAIEYTMDDVRNMLDINYTGVFFTATTVAKEMMKYKCRGSIVLVASMSGFVANKGLISPVYNSSKAAVIQLGRNLAMEWGKIQEDGSGGIRVNSLCPGHIVTPMVKENFKEEPELKEIWEAENMLGRLSRPEEFRGAGLFLLSDASSFMTGGTLVIDGGHTAW